MRRMKIIHFLTLSLLCLLYPTTETKAQDSTRTAPQDTPGRGTDTAPGSSLSTAEAAAQAYREQDYTRSIALYEEFVAQALAENKESAEIYYNLGNACFRDNQLGRAILNFERALLLDPGDGDIRHNLHFTQNLTEDRIEQAGTFFLQNWFRGVRDLNNSDRWAVIGIFVFLLFLSCVALFLFVRLLWARKTAFYSGIFFCLLMIAANIFAFSQKQERTRRDGAIVMVGAASVNASPDENSNRLFELHEGTKVRIRNSDGNWYEVAIANGSVGWTKKQNVEII